MLEIGAPAPRFKGTDQHGSRWSSDGLAGRPYVVYFYPKAGSLGCTLETQGFARLAGPLSSLGISLLGVSIDPVSAQARFAEKCEVAFPLVADEDGEVARKFGVLGAFRHARRVTFFVGADGKVTEVVRSALPAVHVRRVQQRFLGSATSSQPGGP